MLHIKYNIKINQAAAVVCGLLDSLDLLDLSIFDFLWDYRGLSKTKKMHSNGVEYFSVHWKTIVQQMPFLKIKTRAGIHKRLKKLQDTGLLVPHQDNGKGGYAWYVFSPKADELHFTDLKELEKKQTVQGCKQPFTGGVNDGIQEPVNNGIHINSNDNSNYSNNKEAQAQKTDPKPKTKKFIPPTLKECEDYFHAKGETRNEGGMFFDHYESKGWMVGKNKMKKWHSAASGWIRRNNGTSKKINGAREVDEMRRYEKYYSKS